MSEYSKSSVNRCKKDKGSLKFTWREQRKRCHFRLSIFSNYISLEFLALACVCKAIIHSLKMNNDIHMRLTTITKKLLIVKKETQKLLNHFNSSLWKKKTAYRHGYFRQFLAYTILHNGPQINGIIGFIRDTYSALAFRPAICLRDNAISGRCSLGSIQACHFIT